MRSPHLTHSRIVVLAALALVCLALATPAVGSAVADDSPEPTNGTPRPADETNVTIHAVYPDPIAAGDRGEFVVMQVPEGTNLSSYSLTDGHTTAQLPDRTAGGRIALTAEPELVRNLTAHPVIELEDAVALANGGDAVALKRNGTTVERVRYGETTEGELGISSGSTIRWRPLGATDRPVVTGYSEDVELFTLPDSPDAPLAPVREADDRILLAGYTLTSERVADALLAAHRRGVDVRVLLEGNPVGDRMRTEARTLDRLAAAGVEVRVVAGPRARYRYHHAKYAVADERAVVLTENWKPAGTGGKGSRGWGVRTGQPQVVDGMAETFRADAGWRDAVRWERYRDGRRFERGETANASYPSRFAVETVAVEQTELLVTPDNGQRALLGEIDRTEESIAVVQPTVGGWDEPLVRALRRAADRGVEVRLLLSSAWYVREENQQTVERFEAWAERTDAPLSARLAEPGDRYGKIHAKGAILDGERVVVGSLNWNEQAATSNREVLLVLHGGEAADYFSRVFDADWSGGGQRVPLGLVGAVAGALVVAGLAARRVRFAN